MCSVVASSVLGAGVANSLARFWWMGATILVLVIVILVVSGLLVDGRDHPGIGYWVLLF